MSNDILQRVKSVQHRSTSFSNDWWGIIGEDAATGSGEPYTDDDQMRLVRVITCPPGKVIRRTVPLGKTLRLAATPEYIPPGIEEAPRVAGS